MYCANCGKNIDNDSSFCDGCGVAVRREIVEKVIGEPKKYTKPINPHKLKWNTKRIVIKGKVMCGEGTNSTFFGFVSYWVIFAYIIISFVGQLTIPLISEDEYSISFGLILDSTTILEALRGNDFMLAIATPAFYICLLIATIKVGISLSRLFRFGSLKGCEDITLSLIPVLVSNLFIELYICTIKRRVHGYGADDLFSHGILILLIIGITIFVTSNVLLCNCYELYRDDD